MAGAFSGHLIERFTDQKDRSIPFNSTDTELVISGAMSFNPQMHGTGGRQNDNSLAFNAPQSSFLDISEATQLKIAALQSKLNQKLGPEYISQRPGPSGGPKLTYAEGWKIINLANEVFGFNGWSSNIVNLTTDYVDYNEESRRYNVGVTAIVRVTLRDGVYHEDVGYGLLENSKSKGAAFDKCKKEAVTDGLKRALRNFGNLLGNCLYDKSYTQEVVKIKIQPPKFDQKELYRRPEFNNTKSNAASTSAPVQSTSNSTFPTVISDSVAAPNHTGAPSKSPSLPGPQAAIIARPTLQSTSSTTASSSFGNTKTSAMGVVASSNAVTVAPRQQSEAPSEYHDETFPFCSDDDALLALVDLGEGDLGQPLLPETDLGRPIDEDEDESDHSWYASASRGDEMIQSKGGQLQHVASSVIRPHAAAQHQQPQEFTPARTFSRPLPQNQVPHQHAQGTPQQPASMTRPPQANQLQHQKTHHPSHASNTPSKPSSAPRPNENQPRPNFNKPHQHQISRTPSIQTTTPVTTGSRPTPPSVGGFHFPPGVTPPDPSKSNMRPQAHGLGIGVKRSVDAMSMSTNSSSVGMNSGVGAVQVKREVLGDLELHASGDLKRTRR